jgi:hypothetical protein
MTMSFGTLVLNDFGPPMKCEHRMRILKRHCNYLSYSLTMNELSIICYAIGRLHGVAAWPAEHPMVLVGVSE